MQCDGFLAAISARIDGEDTGLPDGELDAHLGACAECRAWRQRAHAVTRRARLGGSFLDHDLTVQVLAAAAVLPAAPAAADGRRLGLARRAGLAAVAIAQLAITVPLLLLGHDHDAGTHAAHELGSFDLSLAIAFAVGAARPALSAGLAWPSAIAAAGLTGTAILDLMDGQTLGADEAQHLVAVAGALLLIWQARANRRRQAGAAADPVRGAAGTLPAAQAAAPPRRGPAETEHGPPGFPGGGTAAAASPPAADRVPVPAARGEDDVPVPGDRGDGVPPGGGGSVAVA